MATGHRLTIRSIAPDPRIQALVAGAEHLGLPPIGHLEIADVVFVDGDLDDAGRRSLEAVLVDPLLQHGTWSIPTSRAVEVTTLAGVTNSDVDAVLHAATTVGVDVRRAGTTRRIEFDQTVDDAVVDELVDRLVANPIVERWSHGTIDMNPPDVDDGVSATEVIPVRGLDDDALAAVDRARSLSLDPAELRVIRDHFTSLDRDPTDLELETLAQTWSEHCAHKTFRAAIELRDADGTDVEVVEPLMKRLRTSTETIAAPFVRSAFVGNAGVIEFTPGTTLALKAETHNHPSAVEPFGGANTGVGGVIRDVLGMAHRPILVTDVLCFGPADLPIHDLPAGSLHPLRIRAGVVDGVADYGNKIGLPTVAGAVLYDAAYTTNPLVFAGCIGVASTRPVHDGPYPGDRIVVLGGATGRDGIRGATFSSATMDATTGEVAGASVQIGDPIVEKLLIDALVGAEDLYSGITDCGAGGLSSAVGEMAEGVGADVDLDRVPRKYPGLEPWEVWLSEAQERMVVSIAAGRLDELGERCRRVGVDFADIGEFTGDGQLVVRSGGHVVADLDTAFLHDARPQRQMTAIRTRPDRGSGSPRHVADAAATLLAILSHPNVASNEDIIRRYDHEILGSTVVRPLVGVAADAPADGVVIAEHAATEGFAVGIGVNPWYGLHDPEAMAIAVVDEAIRNVVAVGADPSRVALLDNFSWGDPRRESTLGELVAAVDGCCEAAAMYGAPFVSGKDSLNNEYIGHDGQRHAVPPTLVITAVAHVPDADCCVTPDLHDVGNELFQVGPTRDEFAGSHLDMVNGEPATPGRAPSPDPDAPARYRRLHAAIRGGLVRSCHDISEGGLAVALAEMCIGGRLGADIDELPDHDPVVALFSESIGRFVVEVAPAHVHRFVDSMNGDVSRIGVVTDDGVLRLGLAGRLGAVEVGALVAAYTEKRHPMSRVPAIVVAGPGTNRDADARDALELAGADVTLVLASELIERPALLRDARLAVVAGGFSYADALGAGRMLALDLTVGLADELRSFVVAGHPMIGICNGFQVLTRAGLLPGALGHNQNGTFDCRWVELAPVPTSVCIWTRDIADTIHCPIAHGEGRFVHPDPAALAASGQIALRYCGRNPNGSVDDIAGVCDTTGAVMGLMPHPENHIVARQHPLHRRRPDEPTSSHLGLQIFQNGVRYAEGR